ncbi:MAG: hypothetical protein QOF99_3728 [Pseudonocardiales bacterium]|jgi:hypothetical protein|nr:hypothetical protein [Pseudonocardiales bacterium]
MSPARARLRTPLGVGGLAARRFTAAERAKDRWDSGH